MKSKQLHDLLEGFNPSGEIVIKTKDGEVLNITGVNYLNKSDKDCSIVAINTIEKNNK